VKPTPADLIFYRLKTVPKWADGVKERCKTTIDEVVNSHAGIRSDTYDKHFDKHNLIVLLQMFRRRGSTMSVELERLTMSDGHFRAIERRSIARRWLKRFTKS